MSFAVTYGHVRAGGPSVAEYLRKSTTDFANTFGVLVALWWKKIFTEMPDHVLT